MADFLFPLRNVIRNVGRDTASAFRTHRTVYLVVLFIGASALIVWARFGFTFEVNRFFAAPSLSGPSCEYRADQAQTFRFAVLKAASVERGGEPYRVRSAHFHSDVSGCSQTTEVSRDDGARLEGPSDCGDGIYDCYAYLWEPPATMRCGREQLDAAAYRERDGSWIQGSGVSVVLDWGVDCPADSLTHNVCSDAACIPVSGPGQDECDTDSDCPVPTVVSLRTPGPHSSYREHELTGAVGDHVTGPPGQASLLALTVIAIVSLLYVGYTGSEAFHQPGVQNNIDSVRRRTE